MRGLAAGPTTGSGASSSVEVESLCDGSQALMAGCCEHVELLLSGPGEGSDDQAPRLDHVTCGLVDCGEVTENQGLEVRAVVGTLGDLVA